MDQFVSLAHISFQNTLFCCLKSFGVSRNHFITGSNMFYGSQPRRGQNHRPRHKAGHCLAHPSSKHRQCRDANLEIIIRCAGMQLLVHLIKPIIVAINQQIRHSQ